MNIKVVVGNILLDVINIAKTEIRGVSRNIFGNGIAHHAPVFIG